MKNYIYLIAVLLITLGLAIATLNERLNALENTLEVEFDNLIKERVKQ